MPSLRALLLAGTALAFAAAPALAQGGPNARPQGGQVVAGQATISQTGSLTQVTQTTDRAAINWQSFNVGAQHQVDIRQPAATSWSLQRVTGPDPSVIAGRITSNGGVALVNRSGIVFTEGAQVDVASLIASNAGIATRDFMEGRMAFTKPPRPGARVENRGRITVREQGPAALVGPVVANSGLVRARLGRVVMAGAETYTLDLAGDGLVALDVTGQVRQAPDGRRALVTNTGTIEAEGGAVLLTAHAAGAVIETVVAAGGRIEAATATLPDGVTQRTGQVAIEARGGGGVRVEGVVAATGAAPGQRGGRVAVNAPGGEVTLASGARIDVSGTAGGGTALVGTTGPGRNRPGMARRTTVEQDARILADATEAGEGGTVVVNSTARTEMLGSISAQGAGPGAKGGFVEVSGQGALVLPDIAGQVALAGGPGGEAGTLLLDPTVINIVAGAGVAMGNVAAGDPPGTLTVTNGAINATTANLVLEATDSITVAAGAAIQKSTGGLTLRTTNAAGAGISTAAFVVVRGNLVLDSASAVLASATGISLRSDAGSVTVLGRSIDVRGALGTTGASFDTTRAALLSPASGWDPAGQGIIIREGVDSLGGPIRVTAVTTVQVGQILRAQHDGLGSTNGGAIFVVAGGDVTFAGSIGQGRGGGGTGPLGNANAPATTILSGGNISIGQGLSDVLGGTGGTIGRLYISTTGQAFPDAAVTLPVGGTITNRSTLDGPAGVTVLSTGNQLHDWTGASNGSGILAGNSAFTGQTPLRLESGGTLTVMAGTSLRSFTTDTTAPAMLLTARGDMGIAMAIDANNLSRPHGGVRLATTAGGDITIANSGIAVQVGQGPIDIDAAGAVVNPGTLSTTATSTTGQVVLSVSAGTTVSNTGLIQSFGTTGNGQTRIIGVQGISGAGTYENRAQTGTLSLRADQGAIGFGGVMGSGATTGAPTGLLLLSARDGVTQALGGNCCSAIRAAELRATSSAGDVKLLRTNINRIAALGTSSVFGQFAIDINGAVQIVGPVQAASLSINNHSGLTQAATGAGVTVGSFSSLAQNHGVNILLDGAGNQIAALGPIGSDASFGTGGNVTIVTAGPLALNGRFSIFGGQTTLVAGSITQAATGAEITNTTLSATATGPGGVALTGAGNFVQTIRGGAPAGDFAFANGGALGLEGPMTVGGTLNLTAAGQITQGSGSFTANTLRLKTTNGGAAIFDNSSNPISVANLGQSSVNGALILRLAGNAALNIAGPVSAGPTTLTAGTITQNPTGAGVTVSSLLLRATDASLTGAGNAIASFDSSVVSNLLAVHSKNVTLNAQLSARSVDLRATDPAGSGLAVNAPQVYAGSLTLGSAAGLAVNAGLSAVGITLNAAGALSFGPGLQVTSSGGFSASGGSILVSAGTTLTQNGAAGTMRLDTTGGLGLYDPIAAPFTGDIAINGTVTSFTAPIAITARGALTTGAGSLVRARANFVANNGGANAEGALLLRAGGDMTLNGLAGGVGGGLTGPFGNELTPAVTVLGQGAITIGGSVRTNVFFFNSTTSTLDPGGVYISTDGRPAPGAAQSLPVGGNILLDMPGVDFGGGTNVRGVLSYRPVIIASGGDVTLRRAALVESGLFDDAFSGVVPTAVVPGRAMVDITAAGAFLNDTAVTSGVVSNIGVFGVGRRTDVDAVAIRARTGFENRRIIQGENPDTLYGSAKVRLGTDTGDFLNSGLILGFGNLVIDATAGAVVNAGGLTTFRPDGTTEGIRITAGTTFTNTATGAIANIAGLPGFPAPSGLDSRFRETLVSAPGGIVSDGALGSIYRFGQPGQPDASTLHTLRMQAANGAIALRGSVLAGLVFLNAGTGITVDAIQDAVSFVTRRTSAATTSGDILLRATQTDGSVAVGAISTPGNLVLEAPSLVTLLGGTVTARDIDVKALQFSQGFSSAPIILTGTDGSLRVNAGFISLTDAGNVIPRLGTTSSSFFSSFFPDAPGIDLVTTGPLAILGPLSALQPIRLAAGGAITQAVGAPGAAPPAPIVTPQLDLKTPGDVVLSGFDPATLRQPGLGNDIGGLGTSTVGGRLALEANGGAPLRIRGPVSAGALDLTARGGIVQDATGAGIGAGTLFVASPSDVLLDGAGNLLPRLGGANVGGALRIVTGGNLTVAGAVDADLLTLTAGGNILQQATGAPVRAREVRLGAYGGTVRLDGEGNDIARLGQSFAGTELTILDTRSLQVVAPVVAGLLDLTTPLDITQSAGEEIRVTTLQVHARSAILTDPGNDVRYLGESRTDQALKLASLSDLTVTGPVSAATMELASEGGVYQTLAGRITADSLRVTSGYEVVLNVSGNTVPVLAGGTATRSFVLSTLTGLRLTLPLLAPTVSLDAHGGITQADGARIEVSRNTLYVSSVTGSVVLEDSSNRIQGLGSSSVAGDLRIFTQTDLRVDGATVRAGGLVRLAAAGGVSFDGTILTAERLEAVAGAQGDLTAEIFTDGTTFRIGRAALFSAPGRISLSSGTSLEPADAVGTLLPPASIRQPALVLDTRRGPSRLTALPGFVQADTPGLADAAQPTQLGQFGAAGSAAAGDISVFVEAGSSPVFMLMNGAVASGRLVAGRLGVQGLGGGADLSGSIAGIATGAAAQRAVPTTQATPAAQAAYLFNGCVMGALDCAGGGGSTPGGGGPDPGTTPPPPSSTPPPVVSTPAPVVVPEETTVIVEAVLPGVIGAPAASASGEESGSPLDDRRRVPPLPALRGVPLLPSVLPGVTPAPPGNELRQPNPDLTLPGVSARDF